ncbi:EscU/YscU/HrcU family type III secretion system export apparatus switch protein [Granulicella cerasi]|uniref:EscU/YscU/HrcU family type III secretion system export apparatus switch protein n=1 Tax=Granulicella cerasi TaxID=741063 RepID=A0ABW1Z420_9BACT|nr:EscU/YscU/HrcU family type III secretion system export apparatus switch protein [Granulicella cerasi]
MSSERTEKATPQRKKKARDQGDVVRSRELLSAGGTLAGLIALSSMVPRFVETWHRCFRDTLRIAMSGTSFGIRELVTLVRVAVLPAVAPILVVVCAASVMIVGVGFAQNGGAAFNAQALMPKLDRLNPGSQLKQIFSAKSLMRLAKSLVPALAVAGMGANALRALMQTMPVMSMMRLPETFGAAYGVGVKSAWVMVVWAGFDYAMEWRAWNARLKMSKQEMREEVKEAMGNPQVKGKIRSLQRAMARRKAKVDMRRASVVVTNPTHYAVALEFSFEEMGAPTVLTKGRDLWAFDIRDEAKAAGVPIVENPPLARSLYRACEPGQQIPFELYSAVAGLLAFLFREQQEQAAREQRQAQQAREERQMMASMQPQPRYEGGV